MKKTEKVDLSKGVTRAVIQALEEKAERYFGVTPNEISIAAYVGVSLRAWKSWKILCDTAPANGKWVMKIVTNALERPVSPAKSPAKEGTEKKDRQELEDKRTERLSAFLRAQPVCYNTVYNAAPDEERFPGMKMPPPGVVMPSVSTFEVCNPAWWERQEWELLIGVLHATTVALRHKQDHYRVKIEALAKKAGLEVTIRPVR